jgi:hypothetical protein
MRASAESIRTRNDSFLGAFCASFCGTKGNKKQKAPETNAVISGAVKNEMITETLLPGLPDGTTGTLYPKTARAVKRRAKRGMGCGVFARHGPARIGMFCGKLNACGVECGTKHDFSKRLRTFAV